MKSGRKRTYIVTYATGGKGYATTVQAKSKLIACRQAADMFGGRTGDFRAHLESGNPARKKGGTKAERQVRAQKAAAKRRVAVALAKFLKQANPSRKVPANVKVTRLKGGGFTIRPVKGGK